MHFSDPGRMLHTMAKLGTENNMKIAQIIDEGRVLYAVIDPAPEVPFVFSYAT